MKEQDIIHLGFERHDTYKNDWYYYYEFTRDFVLITCDSDEAEKIGEWYVDFFETEQVIRFTDVSKVRKLMDLIIEAKQ